MSVRTGYRIAFGVMATAAFWALAGAGRQERVLAANQGSDAEAQQVVRAAVDAEMHANQTDRSIWEYHDHDRVPGKDALYLSIETPQGNLRRMIALNGRPLDNELEQAEAHRIAQFVRSPSEQARARRNGEHDDRQAAAMLRMLPNAFIWTVAGQDSEGTTLNFRPNPQFDPPDMQARVMGMMAGTMVVSRNGERIRSLRGRLSADVNIGWGLLGKLNEGGTFDVERREVGNGHWQITETHVHIGGHALLFKTIGQQEDDEKTEWKPSTDTTLEAAARSLHAM